MESPLVPTLGPSDASIVEKLAPDASKIERTPTHERMEGEIMKLLREHALDGTHHVTFLSISGDDFSTFFLLLGEIHQNPNRCPTHVASRQVVHDVVLKLLTQFEPLVLILETFNHLDAKSLDGMATIVRRLFEFHYPVKLLGVCTGEDPNCVYQGTSTPLVYLRMYKAVLRYLELYLLSKGVKDHDLQILSRRILMMDPREDLRMHPPFKLTDSPETAAIIRESLTLLLEGGLQEFLYPFTNPAWQDGFQKHVLQPILTKARETLADPRVRDYQSIFLEITEPVAISGLLYYLEHAKKTPTMTLPGFLFYGGDQHRLQLLHYLNKLPFLRTRVVADIYDPNDGSCARPTTSVF